LVDLQFFFDKHTHTLNTPVLFYFLLFALFLSTMSDLLEDNQTENATDLADNPTLTPVFDRPDAPIIVKSDERISSLSSHIDENNENEAVSALVTSFSAEQTEHRTT